MTGTTHPAPWTLLSESTVQQLPWEDLHGVVGVRTKVLWRSGASLAGLLLFEPGAALASHTHHEGHHHVYVLEGQCRVGGDVLSGGSYIHIPAGEPHDIAAADPAGCRLFYLYVGEG